ncbi:hypothetical protein D3C76_1362090 [compost metagenome]
MTDSVVAPPPVKVMTFVLLNVGSSARVMWNVTSSFSPVSRKLGMLFWIVSLAFTDEAMGICN